MFFQTEPIQDATSISHEKQSHRGTTENASRLALILPQPVAGPELHVRVFDTENDFDHLKQPWSALAEESDSMVFQSWEWNRIWWKHFGKKGDLSLIAVYDGTRLVGMAPMFKDRLSVGGLPVYTCLRFLGSNVSQPEKDRMLGLISYTDYLGFLITPGYEETVLKCIGSYFYEKRRDFDEIILDTVPEDSPVWKHLVPALEQYGMGYRQVESSSSQLVCVDRTWDEFLKSLNKNRRYNSRLSLKRVYKKGYKVFDIEEAQDDKQASEYFDLLVEMHQKKWNRQGSLGAFYEKRNLNFHREISSVFFDKGWLQLRKAVPSNDPGSCAAIDLNYVYKRRIYGVHTASDDASPWFKKSPGTVLLNTTLEAATRDGTLVYDFLRGEEQYKSCIADRSMKNLHLYIFTRSMRRYKGEIVRSCIAFSRRIYRRWEARKMTRAGVQGA